MKTLVFLLPMACLLSGCSSLETDAETDAELTKEAIREEQAALQQLRAKQDAAIEDWIARNPDASAGLVERVRAGSTSIRSADFDLISERSARKEKADRATAREEYLAKPDRPLPPEIRSSIQNCKATLGMTPKEVLLVYPKPDRVNRSVNRFGVSEQWVYNWVGGKNTYLYFKKDILESWQD
jgi:hypothetical protein